MGIYHARLGPSSASRWRACTASPSASDGMPNEGTDASRMGTACHGVVAECLERHLDPVEYLGRKFLFCKADGKRYEDFAENLGVDPEAKPDWHLENSVMWLTVHANAGELALEHTVEITDEHVEFCRSYVQFVRDLVESTGATMLIEQRVPIGHITGEGYWADAEGRDVPEGTPGAVWRSAGGTSDVILMYGRTLHVVDAKFGRGRVQAYELVTVSLPDPISGEMQPAVYAPNDQLAMYAGGALHEHSLFGNFDTVKMTIVQPPLSNVSEYTMSVDELNAFLDQVRLDAEATRTNPVFKAGEHCTFCPARIDCQARDAYVLTTALTGFEDVSDAGQVAAAVKREYPGNMLGALYEKVSTVQEWCSDIATRIYSALQSGEPVIASTGEPYKLVAGRKGSRQWDDDDAVEALLKNQMRLRNDEMYHFKLISPTDAETLATPRRPKRGEEPKKPVLGERQWATLQKHITQADGKPAITLASDSRPALPGVTDGFTDVSQPPAEEVDLFN